MAPKHHRRQLWVITAVSATILLVLTLAFGLGLGLGLRHHHRIGNGSQTATTSVLPVVAPQTSENFVVGSIVGQYPQDRRYNFTVALANAAPDGFNKTMLVVNGASSRPCALIIPLLCIALRRLQRHLGVVWRFWKTSTCIRFVEVPAWHLLRLWS